MIGRLTFGFVFGCFLLIVGTAMALELVLGISIPVMRAAIALALLVWGARWMTRAWSSEWTTATGEAWLADRQFAPTTLERDARYDVVFGRGVVDLTHIEDRSPTSRSRSTPCLETPSSRSIRECRTT